MSDLMMFRNMSFKDYKSLEKNTILSLSDSTFRLFIYNVSKDILEDAIKCDDIAFRILNLYQHPSKEPHALKLSVRSELLENLDLICAIDEKRIISLIKHNLSMEFYQKLFNSLKLSNSPFIEKYNINNPKDFIYEFFITTEKEKLLYDKYNFLGKSDLDMEILEIPRAKQIKNLYNLMEEKDLDLCIRLYIIFGYDNAYKILNNNFTFDTKAELIRVAKIQFTIDKRIAKLSEGKSDDEDVGIKYLGDDEIENLGLLPANELEERLRKLRDLNEKEEEKEYAENFSLNIKRRDDISNRELNSLFRDVDLLKIYNSNYHEELIDFLLGNTKRDNDCLLRMILNNNAFGIEGGLCALINNYSEIKEEANHSNIKMTSLLDVIDYIKTTAYKLKPNELDIPFASLVKIVNSRQFCAKESEIILDDLFKLHEERKSVYKFSIPSIVGNYEGVEYETLSNKDNELFTIGIDCGSCFKIGADADKYLKYTLTSKHAKVAKLTYDGIKYMCPMNRNGNAIFINAIEPKVGNKKVREKLILALVSMVEEMSKKTVSEEKIEIASITDLHMKGILDEFPEFETDEIVFLENDKGYDNVFYCDLNKPDLKTRTIFNLSDTEFRRYTPKAIYTSKRNQVKYFNPKEERHIEEVEAQINSIYYSHLLEREEEETYRKINIKEFDKIVYNDDWFSLSSGYKNFTVILNRDIRAKTESIKVKKMF